MKRKSYNIISLDVWGNEEDGYSVNDMHTWRSKLVIECAPRTYNQGTDMQFTIFEPSDKQILSLLIEEGYLKDTCTLDDIDIEWQEGSYWIEDSEDGFPLCELRLDCDHCDEYGQSIE